MVLGFAHLGHLIGLVSWAFRLSEINYWPKGSFGLWDKAHMGFRPNLENWAISGPLWIFWFWAFCFLGLGLNFDSIWDRGKMVILPQVWNMD